jgi:pseudo-rSAM protein
MKKYRFILDPDTFLWVNNNDGLVYQSRNHKAIVFSLTDDLIKLCQHLLVTDHLYSVELTEEELNGADIRHFVDRIIDIEAGRLVLDTGTEKGTVSLMPVLKIQDQIQDFIWKHEQDIGGSIIQHIHELTFYINGSKYGDERYYRQTIFPCKNEITLKNEKIIRFIRNSKNLFLSNINLVGDIFSYPEYEKFLESVTAFDIPVTICISAGDFLNHKEQLRRTGWHEKISLNILVDQKSDVDQLSVVLDDINIPYKTAFLVFSEQDYLDIEQISTTLNGEIVPVYNGKNIDFFESSIFINQEDILVSGLSKREVFMRQATNIHHFGRLTILSGGKVHADVNQPPLGTIDDTVYSIVYKEFTEGKSWFKIRDHIPCKDCVYQWLCPSPSNYETVIGRPNLCHVKP